MDLFLKIKKAYCFLTTYSSDNRYNPYKFGLGIMVSCVGCISYRLFTDLITTNPFSKITKHYRYFALPLVDCSSGTTNTLLNHEFNTLLIFSSYSTVMMLMYVFLFRQQFSFLHSRYHKISNPTSGTKHPPL